MSNKYHNKITEHDGIRFQSRAEAQRYQELKILAHAGRIHSFVLQPEFVLQDKFIDATGAKQRAIVYRADFGYHDCDLDRYVVEEIKGNETQVWLIKKKMFLNRYRNIELRVLKA